VLIGMKSVIAGMVDLLAVLNVTRIREQLFGMSSSRQDRGDSKVLTA